MNALIFADNRFQAKRLGVLRAPGAHRIATHLRQQQIQTEVIDFYLDWTIAELKTLIDTIITSDTLFVAFSCSLMFDGVTEFKEIRDYIKGKNANIAIVIGGYGTTQKGFDGADWYIEGYGEYAITALVNYLLDSKNEIKFELDNEGRRVIYTKEMYPVNKLTSLNIEYQESDFIQPHETLSLETARGCIFKCKFCSFQLLGKNKLDYIRDFDEIYHEILSNYNRFGTTKYIITEDTFNDSEEKVEMLYEITRRLPFRLQIMGYIRADLLSAKPHTVSKLVESGFTNMHFGIETLHDGAGKTIGKGLRAEKLKQTLIHLKKTYPQLYINGTFIVGLPGESESDIRNTAQWIIDSKVLDFWTFNTLMIPKKNKLIYSSEFTNNYLLYGYTQMKEKEISEYNRNNPELLFGTRALPYIVLWKNQHFNYFTAAKLAHSLNQESNLHKKIEAWATFAISGLNIDLDTVQQYTYSGDNPLDQDLINSMTTEFITNYKQRKLNFVQKKLT